MGAVLYFLAFDLFFGFATIKFWGELGIYRILCVFIVALFTIALIYAFKKWLDERK